MSDAWQRSRSDRVAATGEPDCAPPLVCQAKRQPRWRESRAPRLMLGAICNSEARLLDPLSFGDVCLTASSRMPPLRQEIQSARPAPSVPTSTETPMERGSVTRCYGQGVIRGNVSGSRASPGGRSGASLPRVRGPVDPADRRPPRSLAGDDQGVLPRSDRREGAGGQGPVRRRLPRLRGVHAAAQRQGRRLRVLQDLPPGRDRAALNPRACHRRDARMGGALRQAAVVLRLVLDPRSPARRRGANAAGRG